MRAESDLTGADVVANCLSDRGVSVVFTVSGNQNLGVIHSLETVGIRIVHARHEAGAAYMAEGWASVALQPGVCLFTAGPGHTSAITALAAARFNEVPIVSLSAQSPRGLQGRGAFQELDQAALVSPICKYVETVHSSSELSGALAVGWAESLWPVPGPVNLSIPVDILAASARGGGPRVLYPGVGARDEPCLSDEHLTQVRAMIAASTTPVVVARPSLLRDCDPWILDRLRSRARLIVADSPRGMDDPVLSAVRDELDSADLLIVFGPTDFSVAFGKLGRENSMLQISGRREEIVQASRMAQEGDVLVLGEERAWLTAVGLILSESTTNLGSARTQVQQASEKSPATNAESLHPGEVSEVLTSATEGREVSAAIDGGEFGQWMRVGLHGRLSSELSNGKLGAIGGSIPQAVGMSLAMPSRPALALVGDGAFGYYASEIDTAVRSGATLLVVIGNDSRWSAEWHQQREAFGSDATSSTELCRRPYEFVGRGFGASGEYVRTKKELARALSEFFELAGPRVHVINVDTASVPVATRAD